MFTNGKLDYFAVEESYLLLMIGWSVVTATILPVLAIITRMGKLGVLENIYIIILQYYIFAAYLSSVGHIHITLIKNPS